MKNLLAIFIMILTCYLFINWLPITNPFDFSNLVLEVIFNPVKFFAAAITFFLGIIAGGIFLRDRLKKFKTLQKQQIAMDKEIVLWLLFLMVVIFFLNFSIWKTVVFFSFSFFYGMMAKR